MNPRAWRIWAAHRGTGRLFSLWQRPEIVWPVGGPMCALPCVNCKTSGRPYPNRQMVPQAEELTRPGISYVVDCSCGLHSMVDPERLLYAYGKRLAKERRLAGKGDPLCVRFGGTRMPVMGVVEVGGRTVPYEHGYRSEVQLPVCLIGMAEGCDELNMFERWIADVNELPLLSLEEAVDGDRQPA